MRELGQTLTEVTARAGRAGHLPAVAAVRARGEQRRRRQQAGATVLSVVVLAGLAVGLLNSTVLGTAERAPQNVPAHSGPAVTTTTTTPPGPTTRPRPTTHPSPSIRDADARRDQERKKRLVDKVAASRSQAAAESARADAEKRAAMLKQLADASRSTTTTSR